MSLVEVLEQLSKARTYVTEGERCMVRQRKVVARLERQGNDPLDAILFLEELEGMQDEYIAHLDRVNRQVMGLLKAD
jgi:hypothetical protein